MMDHDFWHAKWQSGQIGFHNDHVHPKLASHFGALGLAPGARVFVPLCGKTRDLSWLMARGMAVAGAELSKTAVEQVFEDLGAVPQISELGALTKYSADNIDIFMGDIFDLTAKMLGPVDAVYDRAALVALPDDMRPPYAAHVTALTNRAPQLVISFEYDASTVSGPPFPVDGPEIARDYGGYRSHEMLEMTSVDGLKGVTPAQELIWMLRA